MHQAHALKAQDRNPARSDVAEAALSTLLISKLLEGEASCATVQGPLLTSLAAHLEEVVGGLVRALTGERREAAMALVWQRRSLFRQAADLLQLFLDSEHKTPRATAKFWLLQTRFEQQLALVGTLSYATDDRLAFTYIDRVQLKDALHRLYETLRQIRREVPRRELTQGDDPDDGPD